MMRLLLLLVLAAGLADPQSKVPAKKPADPAHYQVCMKLPDDDGLHCSKRHWDKETADAIAALLAQAPIPAAYEVTIIDSNTTTMIPTPEAPAPSGDPKI